MGLLDSNIRKIQGKEFTGVLFQNKTEVLLDSDYKIDCRGYNTLIIGLLSNSAASKVKLYGYYPYNIKSTAIIKGIDISKEYQVKEYVFTEITDITTWQFKRFAIDVSMFDYIGVAKTEAGGGSLTCHYNLSQNVIYDTSAIGKDFETLFEGTTGLWEAYPLKGVTKNALLYKIESAADSVLQFEVTAGSEVFKVPPFSLNEKLFYSKDRAVLSGQQLNYYVIPIEEHYDSIRVVSGGSDNQKKVYVKTIDFDFSVLEQRHQYWLNRSEPAGYSDFLKVPAKTKTIRLKIDGESGIITPFYIEPNLDDAPDIGKAIEYINRKIYDVISKSAFDVVHPAPITVNGYSEYVLDAQGMKWFSLNLTGLPSNVTVEVIFEEEGLPNAVKKAMGVKLDDASDTLDKYHIDKYGIVKFFENENLVVYKNVATRKLSGMMRNIVVWNDATSIELGREGIEGNTEIIDFNSTNFPGLITDSTIEHVILLPWTRNAINAFGGYQWRMNVITNKGQVYHNYPSRLADSDGHATSGDYKLFDESCVWELPERWTPVKTNIGDDATLIATGKYRYFPALPDESYEMHPAISVDNGYGNGGFPAVLEKTDEKGQPVKFGRFYFTDRSRGLQSNPLGFMGGFVPHPKLSMIATYKSNTATTGSTRTCVFATNDGGRNWFCRYEFGAAGESIDPADTVMSNNAKIAMLLRNMIAVGMSANVSTGVYNVIKRSNYVPSDLDKEVEKTKKFKYSAPIAVTSIVGGASDIVVTTATAHNYTDGEVILFEKQSGVANEWDWIANTGHTALSAGDGVVFKAKVLTATTFRLMECVYNPHNNLFVRHIHSLNRSKDGYMVGAGEAYPEGWILWLPVRESDAYARKMPWDTMDFIRINSTLTSIQRPLGVILKQEPDGDYIYIGVDNEVTDIGTVTMPEGRTDTFRRSSQGVWKGLLSQTDSQADFKCLFDSDEVCYFFKDVRGVMIYIGQQGHVGVSTDRGETWTECHLNTGDVSRYGGYADDGLICIDNFIFKAKQ